MFNESRILKVTINYKAEYTRIDDSYNLYKAVF